MFTPNGLARAAVRFKPASFAGTFVALLLAAAIVSACGILLETGLRASVPPDRYAKAPVIVAADQQARLTVGSGDDRHEESSALPGTARLSDALVARAAAAPGATAAIGDVGYPVHRVAASDGVGSSAHEGSAPDGVGSPTHQDSAPDGVGSPAHQDSVPLTAHGWGSAALTATRLASGDAPHTGEVVVPAAPRRGPDR